MKFLGTKKTMPKLMAMMLTLTAFTSTGINSNASGLNVEKLEGATRVETSIKTADKLNSPTVVLASAYSFADALSSYNIASAKDARLYLVDKNTDIKAILRKKKTTKVYILGGTNTIDDRIYKDARSVVSDTTRIAGPDRYITNRLSIDLSGYNNVGVADGRNFPDALSASPLLKAKGLGLMLVNGSKPYKTNKKIVYTFGAKDSVKQDGGKRLAGIDRYATNLAINNELGTPKSVVVTDGGNFADALSTINLVNANNGVAMLLAGKNINSSQKSYIDKTPNRIVVGGRLSTPAEDYVYGRKTQTVVKPEEVVKPTDPKDNAKPSEGVKPNDNTKPQDNTNPNEGKTGVYKFKLIKLDRPNVPEVKEVSKASVADVRNSLPSGYTVLNEGDISRFIEGNQGVGRNTIVAKPNSMREFNTQAEYDSYILDGLKNTGIEPGYVIIKSNINPTEGFSTLADAMGFSLYQGKETYGNINLMKIDMGMRQASRTGEKYDVGKYRENIRKIDNIILLSGANSETSLFNKAVLVGKYISKSYPYNNNFEDTSKENELKSRSPYSITDYGTAVCEGYVDTFNQAMLRLGIPTIYLVVPNNNPNISAFDTHAVSVAYIYENGTKTLYPFDVVGYIGNAPSMNMGIQEVYNKYLSYPDFTNNSGINVDGNNKMNPIRKILPMFYPGIK